MNDRSLDDLHPVLEVLCKKWMGNCLNAGIKVGISQTYRSNNQQEEDYAQGRTSPGNIITNARSGQSPHNCVTKDGKPSSRAFDFYIIDDSGKCDWDASDNRWNTAIQLGKNIGLTSGADFSIKDYAHMELKDWNSDIWDTVQTN